MSMRIITTGGTFDKHYDPINGSLGFGDSVVPIALLRARVTADVVIESLLALDSLDMQDAHRKQILAACKQSPQEHIVIVHGTDTMRETAEVLSHEQLFCTIVLTGAMVPYDIVNSDALFNLGYAMAAAKLAPHGVYIAMNGELWPWNEVKKNRVEGVFERSE